MENKTQHNDNTKKRKPLTRLFRKYEILLAFRLCVTACAIVLFITHRELLDFTEYFGFKHGFTFVDFVFCCVLIDILTKFFPYANISMGSLKQYRIFHVPTAKTFEGGREALLNFVQEAWAKAPKNIKGAREVVRAKAETVKTEALRLADGATQGAKNVTMDTVAAASETAAEVKRRALALLRNMEFMRSLKYTDADLDADQELRIQLREKRLKEITPVIIFWVGGNIAVGLVLYLLGWLTPSAILLWMVLFYVSDMICVVWWCPIQLFLMGNRCCTTCQIFNWDAVMTVTPLFFCIGAAPWFTVPLIVLALVVLARWEMTAFTYPERFDEQTNASLRCVNCSDNLCHIRMPNLREKLR